MLRYTYSHPDFTKLFTLGYRPCTCTVEKRGEEKSSIVLFHRVRLVGAPNPVVCNLHSLGLSDRKPGIQAPKLALHNNLAASKARTRPRVTRSLILYVFIYPHCVSLYRLYPGLFAPFVHVYSSPEYILRLQIYGKWNMISRKTFTYHGVLSFILIEFSGS